MVANMRLFCVAFVSSLLLQVAHSQEDGTETAQTAQQQYQQFVHPLTNMPGAAEDIETSYLFPDHSDQKFPIGEVVTVLCHFSNDDQYAYNVTAIMGSLNSPYDFNFHVQNYSYKPIGVVVRPGDEFTFEYQFQTVELYYPTDDFNLKTAAQLSFSILSTIALIFVSLYLCFPELNFGMGSSHSKRGGRGTKSKEEWLDDGVN